MSSSSSREVPSGPPWPKRKTCTREPVEPASTTTAKTSSLAAALWWPSMGASAPASDGWLPRASEADTEAEELRWCCCCGFDELEKVAACEGETSGRERGWERANSAPRTRSWRGWFGVLGVRRRANRGEKKNEEEVENRALPLSRKKERTKTRFEVGASSARCSPFQPLPTRVNTGPNRSRGGPRGGKPFQRAQGGGRNVRGERREREVAESIRQRALTNSPSALSRSRAPKSHLSYRCDDRQHGVPLPSGEARPERARAAPGRRAIHRTRRRRSCCSRSRRRRRCCCRWDGAAAPVRGDELFSGRGRRRRCGPARAQTCCAAGGVRSQRERERERERKRTRLNSRPSLLPVLVISHS